MNEDIVFNKYEDVIGCIEKESQKIIDSERRKRDIYLSICEARGLLAKSDSLGRRSELAKSFKRMALERIHPIYMDLNIDYEVLGVLFGRSIGWFSTNFKELGFERKSCIPRVPRHPTKYKVDVTAFDEWNCESAYWLGFIWADGHVRYSKYRKHLRVAVQESDSEHLFMFKKFLKSNIPVKKCLYKAKKDGKRYPVSVFTVNRRELADSLIKHNVIVNRSLGDTFLPRIPETYLWDFIRGYFDGDGAIHRPQKCNFLCSGWVVSFAGSDTIFKFLKTSIRRDVGIDMDLRPNGVSPSNFSLTRTGPEVFKLLQRLYPTDQVVGLARKRSVIRRLLKMYDYALSNGVVVRIRGDGFRFIVPNGFDFPDEF